MKVNDGSGSGDGSGYGSLSVRGNGGLQPLVVDQPEIVPDEQCVWSKIEKESE